MLLARIMFPFHPQYQFLQAQNGRSKNRFHRSPFCEIIPPLFGTTTKGRNLNRCIRRALHMDANRLTEKELKSGIDFMERQLIKMRRASTWAKLEHRIGNFNLRRYAFNVMSQRGFEKEELVQFDACLEELTRQKRNFYIALGERFHDLSESSSDEYDSGASDDWTRINEWHI